MSYPSHCKNCALIFPVDLIDEILEMKENEIETYATVLDKYDFGLCCRVELMTFITADLLQDYLKTLMRHFSKLSKQ